VRFALLAGDPESRDPLDQAIRRFAESRALALPEPRRLVTLEPFDPRRKAASAVWQVGTSELMVMKGAIEVVTAENDTVRASDVIAAAENLSAHGMRVIAVASDGALRGILAFADPVRPGIPSRIASCREAGIRIIMITGDHPLTAASIARTIGIPAGRDAVVTGDELEKLTDAELALRIESVSVIARARPEHKLRIVRALRLGGATVAMTGDGTNDALALRDADIGIAMGKHGSDVARGASDLVLLDDDFSTIVNAVRDGRRIFDNLRHAFSYLVAFHVPLVLSALVVPLLGLPLMLMPIHLVILELIVHPTSSLVFEADEAAPDVMSRRPRPRNQGLLTGSDWVRPLLIGGTLSVGVLAVYLFQLHFGAPPDAARAAAFVTMIAGQAAIVLVERSPGRPLWSGVRGNVPLAIALPATLALLLFAILVPGVSAALHFAPLTPAAWASALLTALVATLWYEPLKSTRG
jgi:P-type Ca2+ transporter type 2C